jgi:hypothetical protein
MTLEETNEAISDHLDKIKSYFKPGVKITVLVRTVADPEGKRDFMMGDDDPQEAMNMIARRMAYAHSPAQSLPSEPVENKGDGQS